MGKIILMSFGLGGNRGYYEDRHHTCSWYLQPHELQKYICNGHYAPEVIEGALLVDLCECVKRDPSLAISSPMVNTELKNGKPSRFDRERLHDPLTQSLCRGFAEAGGGAAVMAAAVGGLDEVSVGDYVAWWREKGARIGCVADGRVLWD